MDNKEMGFDFSSFYVEDEEDTMEENSVEDLEGVVDDESSFDELVDLDTEDRSVKVSAKYPYIKISGFKIKDEITAISKRLNERYESIRESVDLENLLDVAINVNGEDYIVTRLPLTLDTMLLINGVRKYDVSLVRDAETENPITSSLMKAFLFS